MHTKQDILRYISKYNIKDALIELQVVKLLSLCSEKERDIFTVLISLASVQLNHAYKNLNPDKEGIGANLSYGRLREIQICLANAYDRLSYSPIDHPQLLDALEKLGMTQVKTDLNNFSLILVWVLNTLANKEPFKGRRLTKEQKSNVLTIIKFCSKNCSEMVNTLEN